VRRPGDPFIVFICISGAFVCFILLASGAVKL
jgi:hypothetical protein